MVIALKNTAVDKYATFFSDMFENIGIIMMIKIFPEKMDNVALLTSVCSSVKWSFVGIVSLFIVFLSIKILFQKKNLPLMR